MLCKKCCSFIFFSFLLECFATLKEIHNASKLACFFFFFWLMCHLACRPKMWIVSGHSARFQTGGRCALILQRLQGHWSIDKSHSCDSLLTAQTNINLDGKEQKTIKRPFS